jgi:hypothetical protein
VRGTVRGVVRGAGRAPSPLAARDIAELAVMVQFGELVIAIGAQRVARIALADEAVTADAQRIELAGAVLPAWELGTLLGIDEPPAAWLVLATGDEPGAPRIALGTGRCIAVAPHGAVSPLPPGVIAAPPHAVVGVFATDPALRERGIGPLGVRIDPVRLIGAAARRGER